MKILRSVAVFLAVSVIVTVAMITAAFMFWSFLPVQPSTATALATLFLIAPGSGIAAGLVAAIRMTRHSSGTGTHGSSSPAPRASWPLTTAAAIIGGLFGYGASIAAIDLTFTDRWSNPASAPTWLPLAPPVAGLTMAVLLAGLVFLSGVRSRRVRVSDTDR